MKIEICQNCGCTIGKLESACIFNGKVVCQNCYQRLTDTEDKQVQTAIKKPIEVKAEAVLPQINQEKSKHKVTKWYFSTPVVIITLLCVGIFALPLVWFNPRYKKITKFIVTVIVTVFIILSSYLISHIPPQVFSYFTTIAKLPTLSEKDVKLIEALINEINLLDAMSSSDDEIVLAHLPKIQAACNNLTELGSSKYYMSIIGSLALDAEEKYILAHMWKSLDSHPQEQKKWQDDAEKSRKNLVKAYHLWQERVTISEFNKFLKEDCGWVETQKDEATSE